MEKVSVLRIGRAKLKARRSEERRGKTMYQMALGYQELLVILFILLLLFGSTRLPQLARGLGKSIREFKRGVAEGEAAADEQPELPRREALRAPEGSRLEDERTASRAEKLR